MLTLFSTVMMLVIFRWENGLRHTHAHTHWGLKSHDHMDKYTNISPRHKAAMGNWRTRMLKPTNKHAYSCSDVKLSQAALSPVGVRPHAAKAEFLCQVQRFVGLLLFISWCLISHVSLHMTVAFIIDCGLAFFIFVGKEMTVPEKKRQKVCAGKQLHYHVAGCLFACVFWVYTVYTWGEVNKNVAARR